LFLNGTCCDVVSGSGALAQDYSRSRRRVRIALDSATA